MTKLEVVKLNEMNLKRVKNDVILLWSCVLNGSPLDLVSIDKPPIHKDDRSLATLLHTRLRLAVLERTIDRQQGQ